jgi:hypothetical protein
VTRETRDFLVVLSLVLIGLGYVGLIALTL